MDITTKQKLSALNIPHLAIAELAGVTPARISLFFRNPALVAEPVRINIGKWIEMTIKFAELWKVQGPLNPFPGVFKIDWANTPAVRKAIEFVLKAEESASAS